MSADYEREKLGNAVDALGSSAQPIQKRLEYPWLAMHTLEVHGMINPERKAAYDSICERLTADKSDEHAGHVPTTTSRLSDDEAEAIARDIVGLHSAICHDRIYELEDELRDLKAAT